MAINIAALAIGGFMLTRLGTEFMPPLDEGSILFMPVTLPDISNAEIKRILQTQDKLITSVPEVDHVLGKAGRGIEPTDAGLALVQAADTLFGELAEVEAKVADLREGRAGTLSMSYFSSAAMAWIPGIVQRLLQEHPRLRLDLRVRETPTGVNIPYGPAFERSLVGADAENRNSTATAPT